MYMGSLGSLPAVATDDSALIAMLNSFASNIEQPFGFLIPVLIHMEI